MYEYLIKTTMADMLNMWLVKGAAKDASSSLKDNPISALRSAQVSFVPSPQNATYVFGRDLRCLTRSPLLDGFILANTLVYWKSRLMLSLWSWKL